MDNHNIKPDKITKPIQLFAAALVGLLVIDSVFLTAATQISTPEWAPAALVIAAIAFVGIFFFAVIFLPIKFRAEMQTDNYYSTYRKEEQRLEMQRLKVQLEREERMKQQIFEKMKRAVKIEDENERIKEVDKVMTESEENSLVIKYSNSRIFYYLLKHKNKLRVLDYFKVFDSFMIPTVIPIASITNLYLGDTINELILDRMIIGNCDNPGNIKFTELGEKIANKINNENLWAFSKNDTTDLDPEISE